MRNGNTVMIRYFKEGEKRITTVPFQNFRQLEEYRQKNNITIFNTEIIKEVNLAEKVTGKVISNLHKINNRR